MFTLKSVMAGLMLSSALGRGALASDGILANVTADGYRPDALVVDPGAFRVDGKRNTVKGECAFMGGAWRRIGAEMEPCPIDSGTGRPPVNEIISHRQRVVGGPSWVVGSVGIDNQQWAIAKAIGDQGGLLENNVLKMVSRAFGIGRVANVVRWTFDSNFLPDTMRAEIPGSGIYFHLNDILDQSQVVPVLQQDAGRLLVEAALAIPVFELEGAATATLTIGLNMQTLDVSGRLVPLQLLVSLFNSRGTSREFISKANGQTFALSPLSGAPSFIIPLRGAESEAAKSRLTVYSFAIDRASLSRLLKAVNLKRSLAGDPQLQDDPLIIRYKGVNVRNEFRFLDRGNLKMTVDTDHLRVTREGG